jgi:RNA polymerase sigma-70 factor (ECF subfamily)
MTQMSLRSVDADGFADAVRPHLFRMALLAERLAGAADRDDVVQEALVRAWKKRSTFDPEKGTIPGWLMAITADQARRHRVRRRLPATIDGADVYAAPDDLLDLTAALDTLSERQRLAIDCFYFAGLSVAETAQAMRCSQGTVKSTLDDARTRLRRKLES